MNISIYQKKWIRLAFVLILILLTFLISTFVFDRINLYYELKWLDIPMHIWGGFLFSTLFIFYFDIKGRRVSFKTLFLLVITVGILWELYEFIHDIIVGREWNGVLDTTKDLIDDTLGVYLGYKVNNKIYDTRGDQANDNL